MPGTFGPCVVIVSPPPRSAATPPTMSGPPCPAATIPIGNPSSTLRRVLILTGVAACALAAPAAHAKQFDWQCRVRIDAVGKTYDHRVVIDTDPFTVSDNRSIFYDGGPNSGSDGYERFAHVEPGGSVSWGTRSKDGADDPFTYSLDPAIGAYAVTNGARQGRPRRLHRGRSPKLTPPHPAAIRAASGSHGRIAAPSSSSPPAPRHDVQRKPTSANSSSANSPCLRSNAAEGSSPLCPQLLHVTSLSHPGGQSRTLPKRGCLFGSLPPITRT